MHQRSRSLWVKRILLLVLIASAVGAAVALHAVLDREQLYSLGQTTRVRAAERPIAASGLFVATYIVCALLAFPVWWLQILAGYAFGLAGGTACNLAGSTSGALVTRYVAGWLGEDWVRQRAEGRMARFQRLAEIVGNNGLLVVIGCRLFYGMPYAVANYAFGLLGIRARDVLLGSIAGGLPLAAMYAALGARPALVRDWRFWAVLVGVNLLLFLIVYLLKRRRPAVTEAGTTE